MGPLARIGEFKSIEMTYGAGNLQQLRWPPSNIADTPQQALARMYSCRERSIPIRSSVGSMRWRHRRLVSLKDVDWARSLKVTC